MMDADDARIRRVGEILDLLRAGNLTVEEARALFVELDQLGQVHDLGGALIIPLELEYESFVERLVNRQASRFPDVQSLYKKKAELDRKLLGS